MHQSLVFVLLLASVAFSWSNVLPNLPMNELKTEPFDLGGQENDNIFSNKFQTRNILNDIFFKVSMGDEDGRDLHNLLQINDVDTDNNPAEDNSIDRNDHYNGEGFRTEQWHNYPRQLDRLHKYLYEYHNADKRNLDPDDGHDSNEGTTPETDENSPNYLTTNELGLDGEAGTNRIYDQVFDPTNPLFILKIRLAYLNNDVDVSQPTNEMSSELDANIIKQKINDEQIYNDLNPAINLMKVKRESITSLEYGDEAQNPGNVKSAVKKRIFSLWSRLQGLNHKGHELHHRRHLYALYGLPDADGNGVLTAETRATLMRPPGSPLRWG